MTKFDEYAARPVADLLEQVTNDIANYYQTEGKERLAEIRSGASRALNKILVRKEPEPQVYTSPNGEQGTIEHTGHAPPEVETGTPPIDTGQQVETERHTGHAPSEQKTAEDYVMESRWSSSYHYQKNAPRVSYKNEVHHLITDAESQQSDLTQEAYNRGLWNVDRGSNLIRLPSTQAAYQQSPIKVKHRGSHPEWSNHAREKLQNAEVDLKAEPEYTTLGDVPDTVLQQTLNQIEIDLRNDLQNIHKGIQEEWIKVKPDGTQKLSQNVDEAEIA